MLHLLGYPTPFIIQPWLLGGTLVVGMALVILAAEWGQYNINVNAICPGFFPSKMSQGILEKMAESVIAMTPLGRLGGDEDLKGAVVFLASEASRHVTGQVLMVDGGAIVI